MYHNSFTFSDMHGEDVIAIINSQLDRLVEAYEEKKGMTIKMSKTQLAHNIKIEVVSRIDSISNGNCFTFIMSCGFIRTGEHGVQKLIVNGLYLKKRSDVCRTETDEEGLYLGPTSGTGLKLWEMVFT